MVIGFTGTRQGMTASQRVTLRCLLRDLHVTVLYHGGCKGADTEAHHAALAMGVALYVHPGPAFDISKDCLGAAVVYCTKPNLERNRDIVDESEGLIAVPSGIEIQRSGTWMTVRYARKLKRHIWIVRPDGTWKEENSDCLYDLFCGVISNEQQ